MLAHRYMWLSCVVSCVTFAATPAGAAGLLVVVTVCTGVSAAGVGAAGDGATGAVVAVAGATAACFFAGTGTGMETDAGAGELACGGGVAATACGGETQAATGPVLVVELFARPCKAGRGAVCGALDATVGAEAGAGDGADLATALAAGVEGVEAAAARSFLSSSAASLLFGSSLRTDSKSGGV